MDAPWAEEKFCKHCVDQRHVLWELAQENMWKNLDLWFESGEGNVEA
jgi:hypothetical protein